MSREESVQHFLDLIKKSRRGKFKVYIGMIAGVGKTYRMLQEAHDLLDNGVCTSQTISGVTVEQVSTVLIWPTTVSEIRI